MLIRMVSEMFVKGKDGVHAEMVYQSKTGAVGIAAVTEKTVIAAASSWIMNLMAVS